MQEAIRVAVLSTYNIMDGTIKMFLSSVVAIMWRVPLRETLFNAKISALIFQVITLLSSM